jgi:hypothetical protein
MMMIDEKVDSDDSSSKDFAWFHGSVCGYGKWKLEQGRKSKQVTSFDTFCGQFRSLMVSYCLEEV